MYWYLALRAQSICANWQDQKIIREIMVFLQSHGVGTTSATRIYKTYREKAIEIVSQNPYQLAKDIRGIGFISADTIAGNLGIAKNSLVRARAGIAHVLLEATSDGHCGLPKEILIQSSQKLLEIEKDLIELAIVEEIKLKSLVADTLNNIETIFLTSYYVYEKNIAKILLNLAKSPVLWNQTDTTEILPIVEKQLNIKLCAPTGRAAKRLSESTGLEATTLYTGCLKLIQLTVASNVMRNLRCYVII